MLTGRKKIKMNRALQIPFGLLVSGTQLQLGTKEP